MLGWRPHIFIHFLSIQSEGVDYFSEFCWSVLCEVLNQLQARPGEFFLATCVAVCRCLCLEVSIRVDIANFRPWIKLEFDAVVAVGCRLAMNCLEYFGMIWYKFDTIYIYNADWYTTFGVFAWPDCRGPKQRKKLPMRLGFHFLKMPRWYNCSHHVQARLQTCRIRSEMRFELPFGLQMLQPQTHPSMLFCPPEKSPPRNSQPGLFAKLCKAMFPMWQNWDWYSGVDTFFIHSQLIICMV